MESKKKNVVFRKSMHGYNKKDVNDYIVRLSRDYFEKEQQLKSELRKSESAAKAACEAQSRLKDELDVTAIRAAAAESQLAEARAMISELEDANRQLASSVDDLKSANATLRMKIEELQRSDAPDCEAAETGCASFGNAMSVDLFASGGIAPQSAKGGDALTAFRSIIEKIKQSIKTATDCSSEEFSAAVNELRTDADSATGTFTNAVDLRANETAARLDLIRSELNKSIDSEMARIEKLFLK